MKILVLGSAAGGGFPQWNCNCRNCAGVRAGTVAARPRTQSSIAVSGRNPAAWALVNASPDIRAQLELHAARLNPARAVRDSAIAAVVLADAQIDHTTGLYMLREAGAPWPIYCTDAVHQDLSTGNPIFRVLSFYCGAERRCITADGTPFDVPGADGVEWRALAVSSKPPPFSPSREAPRTGDNVALVLRDRTSGRSLLYAPGLSAVDGPIRRAMESADCVLVDGTFWTDDELGAAGISSKRARDMGHLPLAGPKGMLAVLDALPSATRRILIHVNNTNPILDERSAEHAELAERGVEVAWDGMVIEL